MRIGIIGASSQVGSSLAFYFRHFTDVEVVCFVRSSYSRIFFETADIRCDTVDLSDATKLRVALSEMDGVIDCTYPSGQLYEIPELIEKNLETVISVLPRGSVLIYMSTIMAFGMPSEHKYVQHFNVPRTTYSYIKRRAETLVKQLTARHHVKGYCFRLGQVHGFLQSVNASYREKMRFKDTARLDGYSDDLVNVIFISTLAEAIVKTVTVPIAPGVYSLVNNPQWTLQELYTYYKEYYGFENKIVFAPVIKSTSGFKKIFFDFAKRYRPIIESYLLMRNRSIYKRTKGRFRIANVAQSGLQCKKSTYIDFHLLGTNPGPFIKDVGDSWGEVLEVEKGMELLYESCLAKVTKQFNEI